MKRLLVFILLLAGGFYLLDKLVTGDMIVTASQSENGQKDPERSRPSSGSGISVTQGSFGATAEQRGELLFPRRREIKLLDGTVIKETVFVLHARDSQPLRDGLQQLDDVEVTLYENGKPGARIFAKQALVELGSDGNGNPTLAANKDISMTEVVFEALAGSKLEGLHIELDRAKALIDDAELYIYTPSPDDPVRVVLAGDRNATLVGKGLQARLPRDRDGSLKQVDITILSDPLLTTPGAVARARGRLWYVEDTASGTAKLTLADDVELDLDRSDGFMVDGKRVAGSNREKVHLVADQMLAWLARGDVVNAKGQTVEQMTWRMLQLHGAPTRIELPELRVSTPKLTVLPGPFGMPYWITASGGISHIDQVPGLDAKNAQPIHGSSPRRIHLFRGSEMLGATHRSFGFPQWAITPFEGFHTVAFDGDSHIEDSLRTVDASAGLQVFQTDSSQDGVISRGFGDITLLMQKTEKREELRAKGNDGYFLLATSDHEILDLGPRATSGGDGRWRNHRYQLEHGELSANGTGTCRLDRQGDRSTVLLRAPDREIEAAMVSRGTNVRNIRQLRAEFEGNEVRAFDLAGMPAHAILKRDNETLIGKAPRILQTGPASLRMLQADQERPELWESLPSEDALPHLRREALAGKNRGQQSFDTRAPRIDLHYMGRNDILVDALANDEVPARANATIEQLDSATPITVEFEAGRLRALPFAIPTAVMRAHLGGSGSPTASLPFFAERGPWILGDDVHSVRVVDAREGSFEGSAHRMLMSTAAEACLLLGDPHNLTPASATRVTEGRVVTARGAQVRIFRDEDVRLQMFRAFPGRSTFLLPEVELHQNDGHNVMSHMIATCRGDIDVLAEAVLFRGPVVVKSVAADGSTLQDGLSIVAESLKMELHPKTGEILRVLGNNVDLDWSRVSARASKIELDVRRNRMTANDPDRVIVVLANGTVITGQRVTVDYHTMAFDIFRGRIDR